MATIKYDDEAIAFVPLQDSPEAEIVTRQARNLLARLADQIPVVGELAGETDLVRLPPDEVVIKKLAETTVRLAPSVKTLGEGIDALRQDTDVLIYVDWDWLGAWPEDRVTVPTSRLNLATALDHHHDLIGRIGVDLYHATVVEARPLVASAA